MKKVYGVKGMSCSACAAAVERILKKQPYMNDASVNLVMEQVCIDAESSFDKEQANLALEKAGFTLLEDVRFVTQTIHIEGMHLSSSHNDVERCLRDVKGVEEASIQVDNNHMTITYDCALIKLSEVVHIIEKKGYRAYVQQKENKAVEKKGDERLFIFGTLFLSMLLLYIGMSHMLGAIELPLPSVIHSTTNPFHFAFIQFLLTTIILLIGFRFFTRGMRALLQKAPNMDTLVALGTGCAYVYSIYSMILIGQGSVHAVHNLYFETAGVVVALVQFGKYLEGISKKKSLGAITALLQLRPTTATLLRDGEEIEVQVDEVSLQDRLVIKAGEHIPVDGILIEGCADVDESLLTGESMPVNKQIQDILIQGTLNLNGRMIMECNATQEQTTLAKIIRLVEEAQGKKAPIARIADQISLYFVPAVMSIAFIAALLWLFATKDVSFALTIFVGVLVIACPCALGLATPTAIMVGTGKAATFGVFIKSGEALEMTNSIGTIVFDKTGTITIGKPVVSDIVTHIEETELLKLGAALENGSTHPLASAILIKAEELGVKVPSLPDIQTLNGLGLQSNYEGKTLYVGSRRLFHQLDFDTSGYEQQEVTFLQAGKTVVWIGYDQEILGILAIADKLKKEAPFVIENLKRQGMDVIMITGDNEITAKAIAKQAGIATVIAQVLPEQKGEEIKRLQQLGHKVAMIGDGINDAVALTQSEVGIAIGSGSDVAVESADIVLVKDTIQDVETVIRLSKAVIRNIKQNLFWAFFYNALGIPIAAGILYVWGGPLLSPVFAGAAMAFSSVSVVSNALRLRNFK